MVLHNDKWKYKARRDYMRKHGLKTLGKDRDKKKKALEEAQNEVTSNETSDHGLNSGKKNENQEKSKEEDSGESSDAEDDEVIDEEGEFRHRKKLESNSWRFEGDLKDSEEVEKDPELIEQERMRLQEEQKYFEQQKVVVREHLKNSQNQGGVGVDAYVINKMKKKKKIDKDESESGLNAEELLKWEVRGEEDLISEGEEEKGGDTKFLDISEGLIPSKSKVRELTRKEKEKFYRLQEEIKHKKMVNAAKGQTNKPRHDRLTMELNLASDADKYRHAVNKKLQETMREKDTQNERGDFDENLIELLGDMRIEEDKQGKSPVKYQNNGNFDLDQLIRASKNGQKRGDEKKSDIKPNSTEISKEEEDFLDSVLGYD
ncbi:hypothetical protein FOA43_004043 [Brettanomyces nanus]|uniref:Uncharacterized protein n=1 Tax=Eeniella nana TaxID=13502 RepID=A0A875S4T7_EENNA|nr:uncharacterized protein FOA43_004043 [Brettanomyces nanus]QPG76651.1 hypothetical protein FOA43_004043 [Brettanomyces nanus]